MTQPQRRAHHLTLSLAFFLSAGLLACGGRSPQKGTSSPASNAMGDEGEEPMTDGDEGPGGGDAHAQISRLFDQIGDSRKELGLTREPGQDQVEMMQGAAVPQSADPAQSKTCKSTCRISQAICNNAELICELADEMDGDLWANDKCSSGKASCIEASKRCSQCVGAE